MKEVQDANRCDRTCSRLGFWHSSYGGFSFTQRTHEAKIGPVEISMNETRRVNVPVWAGVVLLVAGAGLLFVPKR